VNPTRVKGLSAETHPGLPEPWRTVVRAFLVETYLRGGSQRTAVEYARILGRFLERVPDPGEVNPMAIRAFAYASVDVATPPAPSTVGVRLAAISGLYNVAVEAGLVAVNPAIGIRRPRPSSPPPRGLAVADLRRLLWAIPTDVTGSRDRAIVTLIVLTGLRRNEALEMRVGDLDLATGRFVVKMKGGATRRRVMPPPAIEAVRSFLRTAGIEPGSRSPDERLFGIGPAGFYASLRRRAATAGIDGCTPHALRHSAAQVRRAAGASIEQICALLGHASIATTARYLRRLEPEADDGWPAAAAALGIGEPSRPTRLAIGDPRIRAGPRQEKRPDRCVNTRPARAIGGLHAPLPDRNSTAS
jgi:site-specific recombinase XerD